MVRRSVLFSPGDKPDLMRKAAMGNADVVVFDLEDAVAPADKRNAREAVREVLDEIDPDCEVAVRVNPISLGAMTDLEAILEGSRPDSIMVPKTEDATDIQRVQARLEEAGGSCPVLALIESAAGVLRADEIAAVDATDALLFGAEDLAADIGATRTSEGIEVLYARERTVIAASAAGIDAIDIVYTDYGDTDGLREETAFARQLGYDGKMAIHPDQVPVINDAFTPSDDDIEWAERVLAARDRAETGVFEVDGEMIDAPLIAQAERILERADETDN
ncbi:MAG: HpcH/HpaI aldolase/citrate lyase family protein [Natrinema limicola]